MLPNYARCGSLEAYRRGMSNFDQIILVKMGKRHRNVLGEGVNTLSHQCI